MRAPVARDRRIWRSARAATPIGQAIRREQAIPLIHQRIGSAIQRRWDAHIGARRRSDRSAGLGDKAADGSSGEPQL